MSTLTEKKGRKKKRNWAPYLLILPSLIYLALFFAWPMVQGLILAVREDGALLTLRAEPQRGSGAVAQLLRGAQVTILDREGNFVDPEELQAANLVTEVWFQVRTETTQGWSSRAGSPSDGCGCGNRTMPEFRCRAPSARSWEPQQTRSHRCTPSRTMTVRC
jgi:hypothetical protein